nr:putative rhamnogalacturonate lyase c [Quercus suber]
MTPRSKLRIVCVSDTHNAAPGEGYTLPAGDVLIHAGDLTNQGSLAELRKAVEWLEKADYAAKIVVAGNHDLSLDAGYNAEKHATGWTVQAERVEKCRELLEGAAITYLQHAAAGVEVAGKGVTLRVFGSPFSPDRGGQNWAFQYDAEEAEELWRAVPGNVDVLVTHTPSLGLRDQSDHWKDGGCASLRGVMRRVRPMLHVCGHCHQGRGVEIVRWREAGEEDVTQEWIDPGAGNKKQSLVDLTGLKGGKCLERGKETAVINASIMAKSWGKGGKVFNKPIVIDIDMTDIACAHLVTQFS